MAIAIPSISEIKTEIQATRKTRDEHLAEILASRAAKRSEWSEKAQGDYQDFLGRLARAEATLQAYCIDEIVKIITGMLKSGKTEYYWKFLEKIHGGKDGAEPEVKLDLEGLSPTTVMYGRFDRNKKRHDGLSRMEAGLGLSFWRSLNEQLAGKGYTVRDISDTEKSFTKFALIQITK